MRCYLLLLSYRQGNGGPDTLTILPKVTELIRDGLRDGAETAHRADTGKPLWTGTWESMQRWVGKHIRAVAGEMDMESLRAKLQKENDLKCSFGSQVKLRNKELRLPFSLSTTSAASESGPTEGLQSTNGNHGHSCHGLGSPQGPGTGLSERLVCISPWLFSCRPPSSIAFSTVVVISCSHAHL